MSSGSTFAEARLSFLDRLGLCPICGDERAKVFARQAWAEPAGKRDRVDRERIEEGIETFFVRFKSRYCYCSTKPETNHDLPCWTCAVIADWKQESWTVAA